MKITVENLGVIKQGSVEIDNDSLTIFTGANNSGKSYLAYLIYGYLRVRDERRVRNISSYYETEIKNLLRKNDVFEEYFTTKGIVINKSDFYNKFYDIIYSEAISNAINQSVKDIFGSNKIKASVKVNVEFYEGKIKGGGKAKLKGSVGDAVYEGINDSNLFKLESETHMNKYNDTLKRELESFFSLLSGGFNYYFFPAERSAINLLAREIFKEKAVERDELFKEIEVTELSIEELKEKVISKPNYPIAISDYIYFVNDLHKVVNQNESDFIHIAKDLENLIGGQISVSEFGDILYKPSKSTKSNDLDFQISSSVVKSLSTIVLYFKYLAQKGDVIIIDEPELNLHPKNQVRLARVLAKIANQGFRLIISTHSDYILKELSNLTIMANDFEGKDLLVEKYGYDEESFLKKDKIKVYAFQNETIEEVEITEEGFDLEKIDEVISDMTQRSNDIHFSFTESLAVHE